MASPQLVARRGNNRGAPAQDVRNRGGRAVAVADGSGVTGYSLKLSAGSLEHFSRLTTSAT